MRSIFHPGGKASLRPAHGCLGLVLLSLFFLASGAWCPPARAADLGVGLGFGSYGGGVSMFSGWPYGGYYGRGYYGGGYYGGGWPYAGYHGGYYGGYPRHRRGWGSGVSVGVPIYPRPRYEQGVVVPRHSPAPVPAAPLYQGQYPEGPSVLLEQDWQPTPAPRDASPYSAPPYPATPAGPNPAGLNPAFPAPSPAAPYPASNPVPGLAQNPAPPSAPPFAGPQETGPVPPIMGRESREAWGRYQDWEHGGVPASPVR